jgi:nucleoside-diphosphate-sugar epimerase
MVTGAKGMLGTDATALLARHGHDVVGVDLGDLELTDPADPGRGRRRDRHPAGADQH